MAWKQFCDSKCMSNCVSHLPRSLPVWSLQPSLKETGQSTRSTHQSTNHHQRRSAVLTERGSADLRQNWALHHMSQFDWTALSPTHRLINHTAHAVSLLLIVFIVVLLLASFIKTIFYVYVHYSISINHLYVVNLFLPLYSSIQLYSCKSVPNKLTYLIKCFAQTASLYTISQSDKNSNMEVKELTQ